MSYRGIFLSLFLSMVVSCSVVKDIFKQSKKVENISTSDTTFQKHERINTDWVRIDQSILSRHGLLTIRFDSLTSVFLHPDQSIQAIGYNPVIESANSEFKSMNVRDSISILSTESIHATGSTKKEISQSEVSFKKEVIKTPSVTPWIGAGLAVAIVILAVLYFFLKRR